MALRNRIAKFGAVAATAAFAAMTVMAGAASAQQTGGITVNPNPVQTAAQFAPSGAKAYEGDAGVITVSIPANTTFIAGRPLRFEECNYGATSQSSCDGDTIQTTDATTGLTVTPNADGDVTFTMDLWILPTGNASTAPDVSDPNNTNPQGFDPNSTVFCDANDPCDIWVGDDSSDWTANSYLASDITPLPNTTPLPTTTTSTTSATTSTTSATTSTTSASTSTSGSTTTTTQPSGGQVPESPYVPLLPVGVAGVAGGGFLLYRFRHRRASNP